MFDKNKFKARAIEKGISLKEIAYELGINPCTLYRKINRNGDFSRWEICLIAKILNLCDEDVKGIFFDEKLA